MSIYSKQRKDGTTAWFYDFMHNGVRYRGVGGATKTQALRAQEKRRNEILDGIFGLNKLGNPPFDNFKKMYLERRQHLRSAKRDELSARTLEGFFKKKNLMSITPDNIEDYIIYRRNQSVSNATINRELACLKRMFNLAIKWGQVRKNPVVDIDFLEEPPGRTRYLSIAEGRRLIKSSTDHLKPILITALNTGMRKMEILKLKWQQVHIENVIDPYIEVEEAKNNKKRIIPINDDMVNLFKKLSNNGSEYVFLSDQGIPLKSMSKSFTTALRKAGIKDFRFHDLRHTFASHYIMNSGDLMSLKEILGHSSLRMVLRYAHLAPTYKRQMINNFNGKFSIEEDNCHLFATQDKFSQTG